ncbi:MAG TPA: flagellar biosynthesis anti-sigma factor FlgM [Steroidobacteraceae bacterium]|nr:flagellar biosynthesis anti-sigma factor FlgM [Steroidobacteraceae bacterium]
MTIIHHGLDLSAAGLGTGAADKTQAGQGQGAATQTQAQPEASAPPQEVQITPAAQLLANVERQLANAPAVDQKRVDSIRQSLSEGTYRVDSARVADGVLAAQRFDAQVASK